MAATTSITRTGAHLGIATVTDEEVNTTGAAVIQIRAPNARVVHGHITSSAAGTVILEGSADGTTWFEDTSSAATSSTTSSFRFANRWAHYRLFCAAGSGTVTVSATLAAITS